MYHKTIMQIFLQVKLHVYESVQQHREIPLQSLLNVDKILHFHVNLWFYPKKDSFDQFRKVTQILPLHKALSLNHPPLVRPNPQPISIDPVEANSISSDNHLQKIDKIPLLSMVQAYNPVAMIESPSPMEDNENDRSTSPSLKSSSKKTTSALEHSNFTFLYINIVLIIEMGTRSFYLSNTRGREKNNQGMVMHSWRTRQNLNDEFRKIFIESSLKNLLRINQAKYWIMLCERTNISILWY